MNIHSRHNINPLLLKWVLLFVMVAMIYGCDSDTETPPGGPSPPSVHDWSVQTSGTSVSLTDIHFVNSGSGWAVGKQLVLATATGGTEWPEAPLDPGFFPDLINSIYFIDDQQGWMASGFNESEEGEIFISNQGGAYPSSQGAFEYPMNAIFFLNDMMGWAVGENNLMVSTENGGKDWSQVANLTGDFTDLYFTTDKKGWVTGDNGSLYQTTDGTNFQLQDLDISTRLNAVHFTDTLHGWVCGDMNEIFRRHIDGSQIVWSEASVSGTSGFSIWNDIHFVDPSYGWVVGSEGRIYKTTDGGRSWTRESSSTFENLNAIHMVSQTKGWIAGDRGLILTYTPD